MNLFEEDVINQGDGTFLEIKDKNYESFLPVPYWSTYEKNEELLKSPIRI